MAFEVGKACRIFAPPKKNHLPKYGEQRIRTDDPGHSHMGIIIFKLRMNFSLLLAPFNRTTLNLAIRQP